MVGFGQNKIIRTVIQEEWFRNKSDVGIIFEERFRPISLELLTLLITLVSIPGRGVYFVVFTDRSAADRVLSERMEQWYIHQIDVQ